MTKPDSLDKQAVARASRFMGRVAWPTVIIGLLLAVGYVAAVVSALAGLLPLWIAVPVVAGSKAYLRWLHQEVKTADR